MISDIVTYVILFLPGILLLTVVSKRLGIKVSNLEKILFGSVMWNYLLVVPSLLIGLTSNLVTYYFGAFSVVSFSIAIVCIIILLKDLMSHYSPIFSRLHGISRQAILIGLGLALFIVLGFLVLYFHTIFVEWDVVNVYIPSAKGIVLSGGLQHQPYRQLNFFETSPAEPIIYACVLNLFSMDSLYVVAVSFFILTVINVFLLVRSFYPCVLSLSAALIFVSMPTVLMTIASRSLYPDLPFFLYLLIALYIVVRIRNTSDEGKSHWFEYTIFTIAFTLMFLAKSEFGLLLGPIVLTVLISLKRFTFWKELSIVALGLPYYIREVRNILLDTSSSTIYLGRLAPLLAVSVITYALLRILDSNTDGSSFKIRDYLPFFVLVFPVIGYLAANMLRSGFIIPALPVWNTQLITSAEFFNQINPNPPIALLEATQFQHLTTWWFLTPYLIPIVVSIASIVYHVYRKRNINSRSVPLLFVFLGIFIIWTQLGCDPQPRRLYYFIPFMCLLITNGLWEISKLYNSLSFSIRMLTFVVLTSIYTWARTGIETINSLALFYSSLYQSVIDVELLIVSSIFFLLVFMPYDLCLTRITHRFRFSKKMKRSVVFSMALMNIFLFSIFSSPFVLDIFKETNQSRTKDSGGWLYYPDVVDYYNENITDNYSTIGFYCNELITFANRSVIDLYSSSYGSPIYSILSSANSTQILRTLKSLNMGYFLKPTSTNPTLTTYDRLLNITVLDSILEDNPQFRKIETFSQTIMYKFFDNYSSQLLNYSEVIPWNYDTEKDLTLMTEQNITRLNGTTDIYGRLSIMYHFLAPTNIDESLWITVKSSQPGTFFVMLFTDLSNRTTDNLSFEFIFKEGIRSPIINIVDGVKKGNFNPSHIEGILIGQETDPNSEITIEIFNLLSIIY